MNHSFIITLLVLSICGSAGAASYQYHLDHPCGLDSELTVIGLRQSHIIKDKETLLDISRAYGLGFNEIELLYPDLDPWVPGSGKQLQIPTQWVLPPTRYEDVVINIPEMRLYRFFKKISMVKTYAIGIGREGYETPVIVCRVSDLKTNPSWIVPQSAWETYGKKVVPPGPDNPLGDFWIGLSAQRLGIHGTNFPWGVGRRISRGCIRMYPEEVSMFFKEVVPGTIVELVYEPVKIGFASGRIFLEVHPDIYSRIPDLYRHTQEVIRQKGLWDYVEWDKVAQCLLDKKGVPEVVGLLGRKMTISLHR